MSNTCQIRVRHVSQTHVRHMSDTCQTCPTRVRHVSTHMSDTCQTHVRHTSDTCQTHVRHMSYTCHAHVRQTHVRHIHHHTCTSKDVMAHASHSHAACCMTLRACVINGHTENYSYALQVHVCMTHTRHNNKCGSGDVMLSQCPQISPIYLVCCRTYGILLVCSQHIAPTDHTARTTATTQHTRKTNDVNK